MGSPGAGGRRFGQVIWAPFTVVLFGGSDSAGPLPPTCGLWLEPGIARMKAWPLVEVSFR